MRFRYLGFEDCAALRAWRESTEGQVRRGGLHAGRASARRRHRQARRAESQWWRIRSWRC